MGQRHHASGNCHHDLGILGERDLRLLSITATCVSQTPCVHTWHGVTSTPSSESSSVIRLGKAATKARTRGSNSAKLLPMAAPLVNEQALGQQCVSRIELEMVAVIYSYIEQRAGR